MRAIPEDVNRRKPTLALLNEWKNTRSWELRADVLDTEVARQIEKQAIEEKVEMLHRHADLGKELQTMGREYFDNHPIEKDSTALKMIIDGVTMEKASRGLPEALLKVADLGDDDLSGLVSKLLQHFDPNDTNIDIKDIETLNQVIVEGTFTDEDADASK
jgi:hypothetical protein